MKTKKIIIALMTFILSFSFSFYGCTAGEYENQWALYNAGQPIRGNRGVKNTDINIKNYINTIAGFEISDIGIIDTGIDFTNPQLVQSKHGQSEIMPGAEHGTNIAGIITTDHALGIPYGCLNNAKLMYRSYNSAAINGDYEKIIKNIEDFEAEKIKIVNCSFIYNKDDNALYERMRDSNILFVCAAENNFDTMKSYPASYDLDNVIAVAGINNVGIVTTSFGDAVDIVAPGFDVLTVSMGLEPAYVSGSSIATAFVTAACAIVAYLRPDASAAEIKEIVISCARELIPASYRTPNAGLVDFGAIINRLML